MNILKLICLTILSFFVMNMSINADIEKTVVQNGILLNAKMNNVSRKVKFDGNISRSNVLSILESLTEFGKELGPTNDTKDLEYYSNKFEAVARALDSEKRVKKYEYYTQDLAIEDMVMASIFSYLLPDSFPRVKQIVPYTNKEGKIFISEIEFESDEFMSLAELGYKQLRSNVESHEDHLNRLKGLKEYYCSIFNGVEELYAVLIFMGILPSDDSIGFAKKTGHAMLMDVARTDTTTFNILNNPFDIKKLCFIYEGGELNYDCNLVKIHEMFKKITTLSDSCIDSLVDRAFNNLAVYGYSENKIYQNGLKERFKENRDMIVRQLIKNER